MPLKF